MMQELTKKFYEKTLRPDRQKSYEMIVDHIMNVSHPNTKSVVDYGCGAGWFLFYFKKKYNVDVFGYEPNKEMLEVIDKSVKNRVEFLSLTDTINLKRDFDLAMNIEVIEHIDKKYEDLVLQNITRHSDNLIFSAAYPGQGGVGHVNEQHFRYWKYKLNQMSWHLNDVGTRKLKVFLAKNKAAKWYIHNMSIFRRGFIIEDFKNESDTISD